MKIQNKHLSKILLIAIGSFICFNIFNFFTKPKNTVEDSIKLARIKNQQSYEEIELINDLEPAKIEQKQEDIKEKDAKIIEYTNILRQTPNNILVLHERATIYAQKEYYDLAVADYTNIIAINPQDIRAYFYRALAQGYRNKSTEALNDYEKVIELDPENIISYNNIGLLHLNNNNIEQAIKYFNKAIEIEPTFAQSRYNLGLIYIKQEDYDNAELNFSKALQQEQNTNQDLIIKIRYRLANIFYQKEQYTSALQELNYCIAKQPEEAKLYILRALVHEALHNKQQMFDDRAKASSLEINNMLTK